MFTRNLKPFLTVVLIICVQFINGQGLRMLTMDEAILMTQSETKKSLKPQNLPMLQWLPGGIKYSYVKKDGTEKLYIVDIETQKTDSSISIDVLNMALQAYSKNMTLKSFPAMEWIDNDNFRIFKDTQYLNFNVPARAFRNILSISGKADHNEYHAGKNYVAYVENDNIYIATPEGVRQVTSNGGKGIVYGQSVHRNEFGIVKGLFWSPNGNKLAFYRMDESMVTDYAIYNINKMPAEIYNIKYPIAGAKSHHVTVGVYDMANQNITYLATGEPKEQYLTNITWSPEEDFVYIAIVNRGQNQCFVNRYHAGMGILDLSLFEERDEKYIEPQHGMMFLPNETNKFIWQSEKDGFNHLYLYNTNGRMISQLTSGKWMVTNLIGIDPRGEFAYFEATRESPLERHVYSVNISTGDLKKLSSEQGTNTALFNSQYDHFLNSVSSTTIPKKITLNNVKGEQIKVLLNAPNPLTEYQLGETTMFPVVNDGTVLHCRMITPPAFDKKKKYPVVVYVYGGPHAQMVTNSWLAGSNLWMQLMAQKGYIVFTLDNRGSSNRGHAFESATHRHLGTLEMEDQLAGVNYLKQFSYVDANRIAVHGWSFGGFMTTSLMTRMPGVFKVGVAGGPVIDWSLYEIMYTERYMDTPGENPEGYKTANLLPYVGSLQDKLLMIHGCDDDVVLWQHSMLYCKAAVAANNTYLDYFIYPGHKHNVLGKDRVHLMQKITEYLIENL
jgi:dipeptidyl-peptidase-4